MDKVHDHTSSEQDAAQRPSFSFAFTRRFGMACNAA
jgi:hypothetical protein